MRILFLSDDFPPEAMGGAGIVAFRLARAMRGRGHDIFVITTIRDRSKEDLVGTESNGLKIFKIYAEYNHRWREYISLYNPQTIRKIKRIIDEVRPDVVNAHNVHFFLSYHSLKLAKNSGARIILTAHDPMSYSYGKVDDSSRGSGIKSRIYKLRHNPFRNMAIRYYFRNVDKVLAVSDALAEALRNNNIQKVTTIHNGIDVDDWIVSEEWDSRFRASHRLSNKKVVLFSGRLSGAKGGQLIVPAMARVIKKVPEAVLLVVGKEEDYVGAMKSSAANSNIFENIIFTGWLDGEEIKKAYFASDVVVTPSVYLDPFPTVNLEAMAAKKPVVGTCLGGTPELVVNNETGYIVDPNDLELMSDKIAALLKDSSLARKFGEAGYERVKNNFSLEMQATKYFNIFTK